MYAEVIEIDGEDFRVCALHDIHCGAIERVACFGDVFRVRSEHVFDVRSDAR
jgi:hypothetical protein